MIKYKLIKTYPGSLPLGTISKIDYSRYPKNWEAFIENDSIILSFIYKGGDIVTLRETGVYIIDSAEDSEFPGFTLEEQKKDFCKIYSVKRLSDGEVFTLGDTIHKVSNSNIFTIESFNVGSKGETYSSCRGDSYSPSIAIKDFQKLRKPLFTTEDGVDIISECKSYYLVFKDFTIVYCSSFSKKDLEYKTFSTQEVAKDYVKMNKPEFSRKQVIEMLEKLQKDTNEI